MILKRLTNKQYETFNNIVQYRAKFKKCPSFGDLAIIAGGISRKAIHDRIMYLLKKGYVTNQLGKYVPTQDGIDMVLYNKDKLIKK